MAKNLQQLIDAYPRLMHGEGPAIPGYVGAGWHPIVMRLMADIDALLDDDLARGFRVIQIKQKFAGLRVYFRLAEHEDLTVDILGVGRLSVPADLSDGQSPRPDTLDKINVLVREAETEAARTCEVCGDPGERCGVGWVVTLCERHRLAKESGGKLDFEGEG